MVLEKLAELRYGVGPVLCRHALATSANTDLDHAALDRVGDVDACLQTRRALSVQALDGGTNGEAGRKGSSTELGCTAARGEDGADGDVFDELGVDTGALDEGLEGAVEEVGGLGVFEATLATLCDGCAEGACYYNLWVD